MTTSGCEWCGASTLTRRAGARFCSDKCRVYANRATKKGPKLPVEMTSQARFVRYTSRKVPRTVQGRSASSTDARTWSTYDAAAASRVGEGIGFVLGGGIGCIDLDKCIASDGTLAPWAQEVLDANPETFAEISRSGTGIHVFGLLPEGPGRVIRDGRNIEIYSKDRYMALGSPLPGRPSKLRPLTV